MLATCFNLDLYGQNLVLTLFISGLIAGLAHCSLMCGPLMLGATIACDKGGAGDSPRMLILPGLFFQAGRMVTYSILGAVGAGFGGLLLETPAFPVVQLILVGGAAGLFFAAAIPGLLGKFLFKMQQGAYRIWGQRVMTGFVTLRKLPFSGRSFVGGMLLGFLPCPVLFSALMLAVSTGKPVAGAVAMAAFVAGTVPTMLGANGLLLAVLRRYPRFRLTLQTGLLLLNGFTLLWLASRQLTILM